MLLLLKHRGLFAHFYGWVEGGTPRLSVGEQSFKINLIILTLCVQSEVKQVMRKIGY